MRALRSLLGGLAAVALAAAPALGQTVSLPKTQYATGESIVVRVTNVTSPRDWITIVPAGTAPTEYGSWDWLTEAGTYTFTGLEPGAYEVRAYCCWSGSTATGGGYNVVSRAAFTVGDGSANRQRVTLSAPGRVPAGQRIPVEYSVSPPYATDWISLTPASEPDNTYGQWDYTGGYSDGLQTFDGVAAGTYEVRFYCCWSETESFHVMARQRIVVE